MGPSRSQYQFAGFVALALISFLPWSSHASAGTDESTMAQAVVGAEIAKTWCTECHEVGPQITGIVQIDIPTFYKIANRTGQSVARLKNYLLNPHPPMPDLNLSQEQRDNLATYIMSLKRPDGI